MIREFMRFELRNQLTSPLCWITFVLFLGLTLFSNQTVSLGGVIGNAQLNAPLMTMEKMAIFSLLSMFMLTVFVAQPLVRDQEQGVADLYFSKPISKADYLLGRIFAGLTLCLLLFALMTGMLALGMHLPWTDASRVGPQTLQPYLATMLYIAVPNVLFMVGVLALLASVTRSILMAYVGIVLMFVLWGVSQSMFGSEESRTLAVMLDPFGMGALSAQARYWLVPEINSHTPELTGLLLANRLLWGTMGVVLTALAIPLFKTERLGTGRGWFKRRAAAAPAPQSTSVPALRRRFTAATSARIVWYQFWHLCQFHLAGMVKSGVFIAFVMLSLLQYAANLNGNLRFMGVPQYPVTSWALEVADRGMGLFLALVIIFFAGELFQKERAAKLHEVSAACPTPDLLPLLAKSAALIGGALVFMLVLALGGIGFQLVHGYTQIEAVRYAGALTLAVLPYVAFSMVAMAVQAIVGNKYVGYAVVFLLIGLRLSAASLGLEDMLLVFGSAPPILVSDMNGYGNNLTSHLLMQLYWLLFGASLLIVAASTSVRSADLSLRQRLAKAGATLRGPTGLALASTLLGFGAVGGYVYYNTHVLNHYLSAEGALDLRQQYELAYRRFEQLPQPKIHGLDVALDMSPSARTVALSLQYQVHNPHPAPISEVHLLVTRELALDEASIDFATITQRDPRFGLYVLHLNTPLASGTSASWRMKLAQSRRV